MRDCCGPRNDDGDQLVGDRPVGPLGDVADLVLRLAGEESVRHGSPVSFAQAIVLRQLPGVAGDADSRQLVEEVEHQAGEPGDVAGREPGLDGDL